MSPDVRTTRRIANVLVVGILSCAAAAVASALLAEAFEPTSRGGQTLRGFALLAVWGFSILGIVHLVWLVGAIQCARTFGRRIGKPPDPAWAAVAYFVPIASLFVPYRHLRTLRSACDPQDLEVPGERRERRGASSKAQVKAPILEWWICFLLAPLAFFAMPRFWIVAIAYAIPAFLWSRVVRGITDGFVERSRRLEAGATSVDDDPDEDEDEAIVKRRTRASRRQAVRRVDGSARAR
jgi:MFS family permease